ncbi:MAG: hypothetical protein ACE5E5_16375 [Phycisphaerae bacterium]
MGEAPKGDGTMKVCEICEEHPAVNDGLCYECQEYVVNLQGSPEGLVLRILQKILGAAEEGGLTVGQSNAIALKIMRMIEKTDGTLCQCNNFDHESTVDDVCLGVIDGILDMLRDLCDGDD